MTKRIAFVHTDFLIEDFRTRVRAEIPTADCKPTVADAGNRQILHRMN